MAEFFGEKSKKAALVFLVLSLLSSAPIQTKPKDDSLPLRVNQYFTPKESTQSHSLEGVIASTDRVREFMTGDIIAHTSKSRQSKIIRTVTNDRYTHIGLIVEKGNQKYVIEAVEPVKYTPLGRWIDRGIEGKYTVKRLPSDYAAKIPLIIQEAEKHLKKHYDLRFNPSDRKMYCSELVSKAIKRGAGIQIGNWVEFAELINHKRIDKTVRKEIKRRWGKIPKELKVITPESIMNSGVLTPVYTNY